MIFSFSVDMFANSDSGGEFQMVSMMKLKILMGMSVVLSLAVVGDVGKRMELLVA